MSDITKRSCRPGYDLQKEQAIQEAIIEIRELRAALQHETDCVEAAKAEIAALRAELAGLRSSMEFRTSLIGRTEAERDELRAKIEAMERQEPVACVWRCDNGHIHGSCEQTLPMGTRLYALPGAKGE